MVSMKPGSGTKGLHLDPADFDYENFNEDLPWRLDQMVEHDSDTDSDTNSGSDSDANAEVKGNKDKVIRREGGHSPTIPEVIYYQYFQWKTHSYLNQKALRNFSRRSP